MIAVLTVLLAGCNDSRTVTMETGSSDRATYMHIITARKRGDTISVLKHSFGQSLFLLGSNLVHSFQNSKLTAALSKGQVPPQRSTAVWLSVIADLSSSNAARAAVKLLALPLSSSSLQLCSACPMSASISANTCSISLPACHWSRTEALTGCASNRSDANPRPTPYSVLARTRMFFSSAVGVIILPSDCAANNPSHETGCVLLCINRRRAASLNADATLGELDDSSPRTAARKLCNPVS
jgi:hypothetical protein